MVLTSGRSANEITRGRLPRSSPGIPIPALVLPDACPFRGLPSQDPFASEPRKHLRGKQMTHNRAAALQLHVDDGQSSDACQGARNPAWPSDWPEDGPIDLDVHDRPHASSDLEWW